MRRPWWNRKAMVEWEKKLDNESNNIKAALNRMHELDAIAESPLYGIAEQTAAASEADQLHNIIKVKAEVHYEEYLVFARLRMLPIHLSIALCYLSMVLTVVLSFLFSTVSGVQTIIFTLASLFIAKRYLYKSDSNKSARPLEFSLRLFLSSATCEAILGDLDEQFDLDCARFGKRRAQVIRACDLTRSLWPFVSEAVRKFVGWSTLASAVEWVRRHV